MSSALIFLYASFGCFLLSSLSLVVTTEPLLSKISSAISALHLADGAVEIENENEKVRPTTEEKRIGRKAKVSNEVKREEIKKEFGVNLSQEEIDTENANKALDGRVPLINYDTNINITELRNDKFSKSLVRSLTEERAQESISKQKENEEELEREIDIEKDSNNISSSLNLSNVLQIEKDGNEIDDSIINVNLSGFSAASMKNTNISNAFPNPFAALFSEQNKKNRNEDSQIEENNEVIIKQVGNVGEVHVFDLKKTNDTEQRVSSQDILYSTQNEDSNSFLSFLSSIFFSSLSLFSPSSTLSLISSDLPTISLRDNNRFCSDNTDYQEYIPPPRNPYVSKGAWPVPHHDNYATASSNETGIEIKSESSFFSSSIFRHDVLSKGIISANPINLFYSNDNKYLWGVSWGAIMKIKRDNNNLILVDFIKKENIFTDVFHGAYSLLSSKDVLYVAENNSILAAYDEPNTDSNKITLHSNKYVFTDDIPQQNDLKNEAIRGLCMTYDGYLIWVTNNALVGVVNSDLLNGFDKTEAFVNLREVLGDTNLDMSNNIACDENHSVFIVTNKYLHKLKWNVKEKSLKVEWNTAYKVDSDETSGGRLGGGSGSTPTLMGFGDKKYICITDAARVMNVVIIKETDGNIVNEIPVTFGISNPKQILSEQSLLVKGFKIVAVNNTPGGQLASSPFSVFGRLLRFIKEYLSFVETASNFVDVVNNVWPVVVGDAPKGIQQFKFDYKDNSLCTTWVNNDVSIPNAIPSMSSHKDIIYGIGKRGMHGNSAMPYVGMWTLEAIDWNNGSSLWYYNIATSPTKNSVYAATIIGPNEIVSGVLEGIVRITYA